MTVYEYPNRYGYWAKLLSNPSEFHCSFPGCDNISQDANLADRHFILDHLPQLWTCMDCGNRVKSRSRLVYHSKLDHIHAIEPIENVKDIDPKTKAQIYGLNDAEYSKKPEHPHVRFSTNPHTFVNLSDEENEDGDGELLPEPEITLQSLQARLTPESASTPASHYASSVTAASAAGVPERLRKYTYFA